MYYLNLHQNSYKILLCSLKIMNMPSLSIWRGIKFFKTCLFQFKSELIFTGHNAAWFKYTSQKRGKCVAFEMI